LSQLEKLPYGRTKLLLSGILQHFILNFTAPGSDECAGVVVNTGMLSKPAECLIFAVVL
jgi:hypothetical protein